MKRSYLLWCILMTVVATQAQNQDTVFKYLDENLTFTTAEKASYAGVAVKQGNSWLFYAQHSDTTPLLRCYFKDKKLTTLDGPYVLFQPKYKKIEEGYFHENKKVGVWRFYHPNGQLKDSGFFDHDRYAGEWKSWHVNGKLAIQGNYPQQVTEEMQALDAQAIAEKIKRGEAPVMNAVTNLKDGFWQSWYADGRLESAGQYHLDKMEGEWKWFRENGQPATVEKYRNGKLVDIACFDSAGKPTGSFCSVARPPLLQYDITAFNDYMRHFLRWPEEAWKQDITGEVRISFQVKKDGTMQDFHIQSSPHELLSKEVERLIKTLPRWEPALSHNRIVDYYVETSIPFYK
jgi:TonB family protein